MSTAQAADTREAARTGTEPADVNVEVDSHGQLNAERDAPVGGQAVLEGVMMRGVSHWAVAVRKPTPEQLRETHRSPEEAALGEIEVTAYPLKSALQRHRVLRLPIIRGIVALGGSLAVGFRALEVSANAQLPPEEPESGQQAPAGAAGSGHVQAGAAAGHVQASTARPSEKASRRKSRAACGSARSWWRSRSRSCCSSWSPSVSPA